MATAAYIKETRQHLSAMRTVMAYSTREEKSWDEQSGQRLISSITCDGMSSILEFEATKAKAMKSDGQMREKILHPPASTEGRSEETVCTINDIDRRILKTNTAYENSSQ